MYGYIIGTVTKVTPKNIICENNNIGYFDQPIEASAYGRQVAKFLKEQYPEKSIQELFNKLTDLSLEKEVAYFVNIYKDPAISKEAKQKFYRALFNELYNT